MTARRLFVAVFVVTLMVAPKAHAARLQYVSDLIDTSGPGALANHLIHFTTTQAIPPGGSIVLQFAPEFVIPSSFDYTDTDVAVYVGTTSVDRSVSGTPSATQDGVSVVGHTITIALASGVPGIDAGQEVELRFGTIAQYEMAGLSRIVNPSGVTSYRIDITTRDQSNAVLDYNSAMIAVVAPVGIVAPLPNIAPQISNGFPSGTIEAGNSTVELSVQTDKMATCRYETTPGVDYASMTHSFSPGLSTQFYAVVSGLADGTTYNYYVRCMNQQNGSNADDYVISFTLKPTPISNTSVVQVGGGVIGSGSYVNGSTVLYLANVSLAGYGAPGSSVTVLQDGAQAATTQVGSDGSFLANVINLERGAYTFVLYQTDQGGVKSASYSSTFSVSPATSNAVSGIVLSPTLTAPTLVNIGAPIKITGATIPNSQVEVHILPPPESTGAQEQVLTASSTPGGAWSVTVSQGESTKGTYTARARVTYGASQSDYSKPVYIGIGGEAAAPAGGLVGDLNGDGKVNLVDFSILLTFWGGTGIADLNHDGTVNLADFSIMLFNWTG